MKLITKNDKIYGIVKENPAIKEVLIKIAPGFKKLNNPILFKTVARVTTVEKAAKMAGIKVEDLLERLNNNIEKE